MKINQLTFFRFLAAVLVVIFHFGREMAPFSSPTVLMFVEHFNALVSFFFLLSGFVLAVSSFKKPEIVKTKFYISRLARIYPLYLFALFVYFLPGMMNGDWLQNMQWKQVATNLTLTQSLFPDNALTLNYPGWSLSVELCFYLSFPLLFSFLYKRSSKFIMITAGSFWVSTLVAYALSMDVFDVPGNYTMYFPAYHFGTFILGVAAGLIFSRHKEAVDAAKKWLGLSTLIFAVASAALILIPNPIVKYYHSGLFNPLFLSIVLLFAIDRAPFKKILSSRPLVMLGEVSYGIYILQYSMWCLFFYIGGHFNIPAFYNFYCALGALIVSSAVFYYLIEMPAVDVVKSMLSRKTPKMVPVGVPQLPTGYGFNHANSMVRMDGN